ncbi:MAG: DUF115 domain-containing protein, partial [Treponema sp.]|nr:DUF115 domain-containing protein [Treponema sp.]
ENTSGLTPLVLRNRAAISLDEDWYAAVEEKIKTRNSQTNVNRATQKRFGKRWVRNLSRNMKAVLDFPGISLLEECLADKIRERDIPVFLAAAGPSLDKAGSMLDEIYKRCIVVAVDTSLRFLLSRNIEPDFVVSVDPQYWNYRHLDRTNAPKTRLIAESAVYPPVLRHSFGGIFLSGSFFPLGRFIEDRVDPKGELGAGGSVATSAWDFIRRLGTRKLWIAGLDLSFPELKTHFRGAVFEEKSHAESYRFSPAETWNFRALRDGQPFYSKQRGGGSVLTDKRLSLYASWFESRFSQYHEMTNYSFSSDGLDLKGLETAPPGELLALPERREEIDHLLEEAYKTVEEDFTSVAAREKRGESYESARKTLLGGLEEIKKIAENSSKCAGEAAVRAKTGHLGSAEQEKTFKKLDGANKTIAESAVKGIAGFLFPETDDWEEEIAAKWQNPLVQHLEFSLRFHSALSEAAGYNLRILMQKSDFYAEFLK